MASTKSKWPSQARNPPRRCVFCGGGPITREHIFPAWMKEHLPGDHWEGGTDHHVSVGHWRSAVRPHLFKPGKLHRVGDHRSQKLKVACASCNNGWMSRLENAAKPLLIPLIQGRWGPLTLQQQVTLAAWATVHTMVWEFSEEQLVAVTAADREHVRQHSRPPDRWLVWIGGFSGAKLNGGNRHSAWSALSHEEYAAGVRTPNVQVTGFAIGKVFFKTFSTEANLPEAVFNDEFDAAQRYGLRLIWPDLQLPPADIWAPPLRTVSDEDFIALMDSTALSLLNHLK